MRIVFTMILVLTFSLIPASGSSRRIVPNPVLVLAGQTYHMAGGKAFTRYHYFVFNFADYPKAMFAAAPELPPCGTNAKSSRTWVDILDQGGKRLYGFCAFADTNGLSDIWFDLPREQIPPSWVYIEMNDRQTNTKYKSNLADTTL